jgi:hypothetical protein
MVLLTETRFPLKPALLHLHLDSQFNDPFGR